MGIPVAAAKASDDSLSRRNDGNKRRVLYAEDQTSTRIVTAALLEHMGFEVVAVEDGELALAEARISAFDMILLDIEMPVMDGVTAARMIRAEAGPCSETPILALSAFLADSTEHSVWRDAFDSALPKPASRNELERAMTNLMNRHNASLRAARPVAAWHDFRKTLPGGTLLALAQAAREQMENLVLAMGSCIEAGDTGYASRCRDGLERLAISFGASELTATIAASSVRPDLCEAQDLMSAIAAWHKRQSVRH